MPVPNLSLAEWYISIDPSVIPASANDKLLSESEYGSETDSEDSADEWVDEPTQSSQQTMSSLG